MDPFGDQQTTKNKNKNSYHQHQRRKYRSSDDEDQHYQRPRYHKEKEYQEDRRSRYDSKYRKEEQKQEVKCSSCRAIYKIDGFAFEDLVPSLQKQWLFKCKNCSTQSKIPQKFRRRVQDLYPKWKSVLKKQGWAFFGDETSSQPSQTEQEMKQRLRKKGHRFKDDYTRAQDEVVRLAAQLQEIIDNNRQLREGFNPNEKKEGLSALEITLLPQSKFISNAENKDQICSICLSNYIDEDLLITLPCNHFFHANCITKWLLQKQTCPLCKSFMVVVEQKVEQNEQEAQKEEQGQHFSDSWESDN